MALSLRPRAVPLCTACLRSYGIAGSAEMTGSSYMPWTQQVRGKKRSTRSSGIVPVRLLKDLVGFGRKGSIIPVATGEMRNKFFPRRIAEYVTMPELKTLREANAPIERDYTFGKEQSIDTTAPELGQTVFDSTGRAAMIRAQQKKVEPEKVTPERSAQLLEIFVKPVLEFYRQPIPEEKEPEAPAPPEPQRERRRTASSAASDLLAARSQVPLEKRRPASAQGIYGSVSALEILVAIRAAIATNDEAARVIVGENDIHFFDEDVRKEGKIKHLGDYTIEITVKGSAEKIKRTVRVTPQDA